jgi:hypothetical protein
MKNAWAMFLQSLQVTQRGLLKVSDWMTQSFRIGLVLLVVAYAIGIAWFVPVSYTHLRAHETN